MSIATKTGDKGTTGTLFGERVGKSDAVIQAVGDVDELNACLGLAKPELKFRQDTHTFAILEETQRTLTYYMGELSAGVDHREDYSKKYTSVTLEDVEKLNQQVIEVEKNLPKQKDWVLYGNSSLGSKFDFASKVCRRAERSVVSLMIQQEPVRAELLQYINRLSDLLYLLARKYDNTDK
jgi:cob(I)alamin adenosyltransferase